MPPPGAAGSHGRSGREDSDIIVALIRTAFIIAYILMRQQGYPVPAMGRPDDYWRFIMIVMDSLAGTAIAFTLLLLVLYLRGFALRRLRPVGIIFDLIIIGSAIAVFRQAGYDAFDLYYLIVIPAAVWYRRAGAVSVAVLAIVISSLTPHLFFGHPLGLFALQEALLTHGALLLIIAVIAGYMMRARDAEYLAIAQLRQEMRFARTLQSGMLPARPPAPEGYDLGVVFTPARQVGGDFYDLRLLDPDHLLIVLADMSGKSVYGLVHLSLVYSHLQAAVREHAAPADIARQVNAGAYEALQPESYAALFIGILRLSDGLLTFVNCGHVPPLVVSHGPDTAARELASGSAIIGAMPDPEYVERTTTLAAGDLLLCFSDGISEARNNKREWFGEERVAELAREQGSADAQALADSLLAAVQRFAARPGQDDITAIALKRL